MMWKVRVRLLIDKIKRLFKKKKPQPRFSGPLYQLRPQPAPKSMKTRAGVVLLAFLCECGVIVYGDIKYIVTRGGQGAMSSEEIWARALEQMRKKGR